MPKTRIKVVKINKVKLFTFIIVCFLIAFFSFGSGRNVYYKFQYPVKYSDLVEKYSDTMNVDKHLVYAIIKVESNYNPNATSKTGAKGLMQLMDNTAQWCGGQINLIGVAEKIYEPDVNIQIGVWYLKMLIDHYDGDIKNSLAAYNGGMGNVSKWLSDPKHSDGEGGLAQIPFEETRNYVNKVLKAYEIYKSIYGGLNDG